MKSILKNLFILILSTFFFSSCVTTIPFAYKPNHINEDKLQLPVYAEVEVEKMQVPESFKTLLKIEDNIKLSMTREVDEVFSERKVTKEEHHDLNIKVDVKDYKVKSVPWGLFWFPLWYIGAPVNWTTGEISVEVSIFDNNTNTLIKTYSSSKKIVKPIGIYFGHKYLNVYDSIHYIPYQIMNQSMDEIKTKVVADNNVLSTYWDKNYHEEMVHNTINSGQEGQTSNTPIVDDGETSIIPGTWKSTASGNEFEVRLTPDGFKYNSKKDPASFAFFKLTQYPNFICSSVSGTVFSQVFIGSTANFENGTLKLFNNESQKSYNLVKTSNYVDLPTQQQQGNQTNNGPYSGKENVNKKFNPKDKSFQYSVTKENQTEQIRKDWEKKGGSINVTSLNFGYNYLSQSTDMMDLTGNGGNFNVTTNFINLKVPDFASNKSNWSSFLFGFAGAVGYNSTSTQIHVQGYNNDMSMNMLTFTGNVNIGYTFGLGRFLDPTNWKGVAIDVIYKPSWVYSKLSSSDSQAETPGNSSFNFTSFGVDFNFSNFKSSVDKIAPKAASKIGFIFIPETSKTPLIFSISYGLVWYTK